MKTSELTGAALDWAVAKCDGSEIFFDKYDETYKFFDREEGGERDWKPSTDWAQGGPIIGREKITVRFWVDEPFVHAYKWNTEDWLEGPTPLIAAMRCYVASKLGDEIELPKELT